MTRSSPTIRKATSEDAKAFSGKLSLFSFRGYVAELDGELLGIAGVYYQDGHPIAFSDIKCEMRKYKKTMVLACKMLVELFDSLKGPVYAVASPSEPTAPYLLVRLGFKPTGLFGPEGETLVRGPAWQ